jgi:catalase
MRLVGMTFFSAAVIVPVSAQVLTRDNGSPVGDNQNSQTAGPEGSSLLQDTQLLEKLQRFDRERIPERVVHARGTGAFGEFVASGSAADISRASLFAAAGKKTPVFVRFSVVIPSRGVPETVRDPHGFATKFYTDQGNWDLVGNNLPIFFIRDAIKFPDMVHAFKPSPVSNVQEPERMFDFLSHEPESTHMLTQLYTDLGIPASYRTMDGNGIHAYKMINDQGQTQYVKFHWKSVQGIKSLTRAEAAKIQGEDFNNLTNDLYRSIAKGDFPKWELFVQVLSPAKLGSFKFDPLDATKVWPGISERKLGTMTLNKMPDNFFESTEQAAFAPSHLVPGIEPSEDRLLQGRLFSYQDTQIYRLGSNVQQIPVNRPRVAVYNHNQDGTGDTATHVGDINYQPSVNTGGFKDDPKYKLAEIALSGTSQERRIQKVDNFSQAGDFYRALSMQDKEVLIGNLASDLKQVKNEKVKHTMLSFFYKADRDYGDRLAKAINANPAMMKDMAGHLSDN